MKPSGELYLEQKQSRRLGVQAKETSRRPGDRRVRPPPLGAPPCLVGPSSTSRPTSFAYIILRTLKTSNIKMNWVFPFEVILSDWVFYENTWCMSCRDYLWWEWDIHVIYLMHVLVINLRVPPMNLCIGVGTHSWLSGRNFGARFEVLCVGWIDESEIVWCISYNHAHGYSRWQWSI